MVMSTHVSVDQHLVQRVLELSGEDNEKDAVTLALQEFVAHRSQKRMLDLMGKLDWDTSFDYKADRSRLL